MSADAGTGRGACRRGRAAHRRRGRGRRGRPHLHRCATRPPARWSRTSPTRAARTSRGPWTPARAAFAEGTWRRTPAPQRGEVLAAAAGRIEAREAELARLESLCSGKPVTDCLAEVRAAARYFRFYGAAVNHMTGRTIPVANTGLDFTLREPIGVCALIVPWNGPIAIAAKKAAPGAGRREQRGPQARAADPADRARAGGHLPRGRRPARRVQRADRGRPRAGPATGRASGRGEDQLHRQHRDRRGHPAPGRRRDQAGQPGAGRQVPERRLRRQRHRPGGRVGHRGRVRQLRAGLLRAQPDDRRAAGVRPVRRDPGRPGRAGPPG